MLSGGLGAFWTEDAFHNSFVGPLLSAKELKLKSVSVEQRC